MALNNHTWGFLGQMREARHNDKKILRNRVSKIKFFRRRKISCLSLCFLIIFCRCLSPHLSKKFSSMIIWCHLIFGWKTCFSKENKASYSWNGRWVFIRNNFLRLAPVRGILGRQPGTSYRQRSYFVTAVMSNSISHSSGYRWDSIGKCIHPE